MAYKMKGIFKGFKVISQIFVVKEHEMEMEIGCPTDVKHVAHIGWNSSMTTGNASPSWLNGIRGSSDFSSLGNFAPSTGTSWASQDFDQLRDIPPSGLVITGQDAAAALCPDVPRPPRKTRRSKKTTEEPVSPSRSKESSAPRSSAATAADAAIGDRSM